MVGKDNCKFKRTIFDSEELPESFRTFGKLNGTLIFTISLNLKSILKQ